MWYTYIISPLIYMYEVLEPSAKEEMIIPSTRMCGLCSMRNLSLKVPGSDSSALQTKWRGIPGGFAIKLHFIPVGNPAPPRPRRPDFFTSSTISSGFIFSAFSSEEYPPADLYPARD